MPVTHGLQERGHDQAHALRGNARRHGKRGSLGRLANGRLRVADARQNGGHQEQHVRLKRRAELGAEQLKREEHVLLGLHRRRLGLQHGLSAQEAGQMLCAHRRMHRAHAPAAPK